MVEIKQVEGKADWDAFIGFPWEIYKGDPHWVPPLRIAVRDVLDVNKNPFFKHAYLKPLLAYKGGKLVGRIVGVIDEYHNQFHEEQTGFFGFFESIDDQEVANALLDNVRAWLAERGIKTLRGPMNPSTNHEVGLLVDGYEDPPTIMMTYNPEYYGKLLQNWGLKKSKDLHAYLIKERTAKFDRIAAHAERLQKRGRVTFRSVDLKNFDKEVAILRDIYNDAWEKNWGFVPMNEEEFYHMAKEMKAVVDPDLLIIAEVDKKPVGFSVGLPDINQAIHKVKDGKLFPTGLLKILWHGKIRKKNTINRFRILMAGVKKDYQKFNIGPLLYTEYYKRCPKLGYLMGEASWILEDNIPMTKPLLRMGGERSKVYRVYDREV